MTDTRVYEKLLQIRACADLTTVEMLKDLIGEFESRERSKRAPSKSVTLYRQAGSGSALKPLRGTTESGDLLVICPIRCAA